MVKEKTKKITVRFSHKLKQAMEKEIIENGYGMHGKSRWVSEAIISLSNITNLNELIEDGENINQGTLGIVEAFYIPESTFRILRRLMLNARKHNPLLEGVQSSIIRASVINKLIHVNSQFCP